MTTDKRLAFDDERVAKCHEELVEVIRKYNLRVGELLILYGNLGYTLGASIEGYRDKGPGIDELNQRYYTNPTAGVSLMLTGMTVTSWYDQYANAKTSKDTKEK